MALLLPLALVLLFGSVEMGYFFYTQHQVVKGVRDGARYASRQNFAYFDCANTALQSPAGMTTGPNVVTAIQNVTRTGRTSGGTDRVPGWSAVNTDNDNGTFLNVTVSCPPSGQEVTGGIYKGRTNAPQVNVTTVVNYPSLFGFASVLGGQWRIRAEQQSAVMGI